MKYFFIICVLIGILYACWDEYIMYTYRKRLHDAYDKNRASIDNLIECLKKNVKNKIKKCD